jgi:pantothenate kinase-related protein Tda10
LAASSFPGTDGSTIAAEDNINVACKMMLEFIKHNYTERFLMETKSFFVGREKGIESLNEFAEQAFNKRQGIILGVSGPGGAGKSSFYRRYLYSIRAIQPGTFRT